MLKNYLTVALRNLRRHKGYAFVNIAGLAIGLGCCLLIFLYVREELRYDRHHPDYDRIYRVALDIRTETANRVFANGPATLAPALEKDFPQVEEAVRLFKRDSRLVSRGPETRFYEDNFYFADPEIFDVFYLPLSKGNVKEALAQPNAVVISEAVAARYFGKEDPLGQTLTIDDENYQVTGVLQDLAYNSHVRFSFIASIRPLEALGFFQNWHLTVFYTYIKLKPNVDAAAFERDISHFAEHYVGDFLRETGTTYRYFLQPADQIHLHSDLRFEILPPGNALYIYIFSVVAILILLIALLNYVNLTTAQSALRAKEVGIRKVVGSRRSQLIRQFLGESVVLAVVALGFSVVLISLVLPWFHAITGYQLHLTTLLKPDLLAGMGALILLAGVLAGLFPAFVLSSLRPVHVLKGKLGSRPRGALLRKVLVTGQFTISLILIVGTMTAFRQVDFMKHRDLGFDKEQMLVLPIRGNTSIADSYETVKTELLKNPAVRAVTASSTVPGRGVDNFAIRLQGEADDKNQSMFFLLVDFDFLKTYDIDLVAGRGFQKEISTDQDDAFLINEAGLKAFGWTRPEEALGKRLESGLGGKSGEIVGVYRDFNYRSLQNEVEPLVLGIYPPWFSYLSLKLDAARLDATLANVERTWYQLFPDRPFDYFFLDQDFDRQYRSDEQTAQLMFVFACLAIGIACLGLLGLAAFSAQARTKEIGIRKVLGASVPGLVALLSKDFARLVLVAMVVGLPVAWFAVNRWLDDFAYHIEVGPGIFLITGVLVLVIALLTVSYQAVKAALADPVESLRYE